MNFLHSEFLYFMIPPFLLFAYFIIRNSRSLKSFFDEKVLQKIIIAGDKLGNYGRTVSLLLALFCMIVALSRPVSNEKELEIQSAKANLIVALDISRSMLVNDIYPSRLEFAKNRLLWLIRALPKTNIALIAYAKDAFLVSPATSDKKSLSFLLKNLSPDIVSRQGTDVANALKQADKLFSKEEKIKRVLVISDGGNDAEVQEAIAIAKEKNLQVSVVVIGTKKGGVIKDANGLFKDTDGNIVVSKRNDALIELSQSTDGIFIQEFGEGKGVELLKKALFEDKSQIKEEKRRIVTRKEWFEVPLLLALFFIIIAFHGLPDRRIGMAFVCTLLFFQANSLQAGMLDFYHIKKAKKEIEKKHYDKALSEYSKLSKSPQLEYNKANIHYKKGDFKKAIDGYRAVKTEDKKLQFNSLYNLGNAYAKSERYDEALKSYESALKLDKNDEDLKANIEYVKKRIKKKKNKKNKQDSQDSKNKKDKKENQKKSKENEQKNTQSQKERNKPSKDKQKSQEEKKQDGKQDEQRKEQVEKKVMSEVEAKKWEKELSKYKPITRPMWLGGEKKEKESNNAW